MDIGNLVGYLELDTDKWEGPLAKVGGKMPGWMAAAGAAGAVALGAAFSAALGNAIDMQAGQSKIKAQLGLTEAEAARAGDAAAAAYTNNFGASMEDIQAVTADVIGSIKGMRDASVDELQGIVEKVATLSGAFEIESGRISQVVGQMLSTGMAASAEEGLDLLTAALQKVPPAVREDLLDAVDEYGPFFEAVGMSGEEAMNSLVAASEKGMYGIDKTGDAVKEFSIRATDMSATSVAAYDAAGLSAEEMAEKILAGGDKGKEGFQQVIDGLLGIEDPVARANAAIGLFGTPLEDLGVNEIPAFLESLKGIDGGLGDVKGAADEMAASMGDNVAAQWQSLQRSFEMIMTTIAEQLLPVLQPLMTWLLENPAAVQAVALALGVLAAAFVGLSVATWAANAAFLASPITWIILGIVALVAALVWLISNWDAVVAWVTEVWEGFIQALKNGGDQIAAWWTGLWSAVGQWISDVWNGFISWVVGLYEGFIAALKNGGDQIMAWWNGLWAAVGAWIQSVWTGFINFVRGIFQGWVNWLMGIGQSVLSWWNGLWSGIGSFFRGLWDGLVSWAVGVVSGWLNGWRATFGALTGFFSGLWSGITATIRNTWNGAMDFLGSIPDRIMDFFGGIGTWLLGAGEDLIQGFIDGIRNMIGAVGDALGGVMDFVGGFFPHSPAKWGPFSGSGWTQLLHSGGAIMDQFTDGMLAKDPFSDERIQAALSGNWGSDAPAPVERVPADRGTEFHYHAAENQSLSDEEALYAALGSPRSPFGGK